ncbi:T9SS type A sorting domain-containing protein [candidate division KSB1 bacterium]|nr:T9SS type A sorting domain-containing protein [candidate division KSB1 bacterium]
MKRVKRLFCVIGTILFISNQSFTQHVVWTVNSINDSGPGSLRETISKANNSDTLVFNIGLPNAIVLTSGPIVIDKNLVLNGPGASSLSIIRSENINPFYRIFTITHGVAVLISGLTIAKGKIYNDSGGGINNSGMLTLLNCALIGNMAMGFPGNSGGSASGGGIYNDGFLAINSCTFSSNQALGGDYNGGGNAGGSGGIGKGGGICNSGTLVFTNCTFSENEATGGYGYLRSYGAARESGLGGGIYNEGQITITNCTLARNTANGGFRGPGVGGGIYNSGAVNIKNSIVALNSVTIGAGPDVLGFFISEGHNLIQGVVDSSNGFIDGINGDIIGTTDNPIDARLDTLAHNGGQTQTIALLSDSPAIDAGTSVGAPPTDQRGFLRDSKPDIGSFEFSAALSVDLDIDLQLRTELSQNYPNPFNPTTTIGFTLPRATIVTLKVFTLLGEEVALLVNEHRLAGQHRIQWQAIGLPSGIYLYRMQAGEFVETKKLVLLK